KTLAESNSTPTSVMAKLCLAEVGDPEAAAQAYTKLKELDESHRALLLAMMLELIRVEKLEKSGPFVTAAMKENEETWPAYREGLRTLFAIAPEAASAEWVKKYAEASDLSSRLRLAMVALEAGGKTSDAVCEALEHAQGSELLNAMGQALRACDGDSGMAAAAYLALARQGYRDSIGWLLAQSKELPEPQRLEVAIGVIENMMEAKARGEALAGIVGVAAKIVGETDPPAILPTLKRACEGQTDSIAREIVAGLLFSGTRPAWNSKNAPKWPDALCEAMATLYEAKTFPGYLDDAAKREKLRRIATGWGSLPDDFKVQAAWLVLAAEGRDRETLTRLLTEVGGE
ncbi:MAG TPA: hypothetical protein VG797_08460, partial [Phycisphaerales bacterium]|nr:hypothetical protein [Phycisphaerales bacterium]